MKYWIRYCGLFFLALLLLLRSGFAADCVGKALYTGWLNDVEYSVRIDCQIAAKATAYRPEIDKSPPLSFGEAIEAARIEFERMFGHGSSTGWSAMRVILRQCGCPDVWYYEIEFSNFDSAVQSKSSDIDFFNIYVFLDGSAVETRRLDDISQESNWLLE